MPVHDELGIRMKEFYEGVPKTRLVRRMPVAIRLDGKAFHTFTRGFKRPFDVVFSNSMQRTMKYLCENIQGCVLGYTQSDEITLILVDYQKLTSSAWFDYEVQKMCSISASMATMAFNRFFQEEIQNEEFEWKTSLTPQSVEIQEEHRKYIETLRAAAAKGAMFDSRVFNIPKEEVTNLVYWRQVDAARNSIQMVGQAYFSHSELQGKSTSNIQDMLMEKYRINWNNYPTRFKRGSCCIKTVIRVKNEDGDALAESIRSNWIIDNAIPMFKGEDRDYIDRLIYVGE